jgi:hypothetical protein
MAERNITSGTRGLLLVMMEVDPEHEEEFNRWYREEHYPERMACAGFLSGRRYRAVEGEPKYLALYELASPEVLDGEDYLRVASPSEWTRRLQPHFTTRIRNVYVEIDP